MNADEKAVADAQVPLWDAINAYATACGGDPSQHVYGNTPRMTAVADTNRVIHALAARIRAEASGEAKALRNQRDKYANLARQHGATVPTADEDEDEIDAAMQKETRPAESKSEVELLRSLLKEAREHVIESSGCPYGGDHAPPADLMRRIDAAIRKETPR